MKKIFITISILLIASFNIYSQTGWFSISTGTSNYLTAIFFNDAQTGYAGGLSGYLSKTTNGGLNWATKTSGMTGIVRKIDFLNMNTGFICGDNGAIRKTTDGGENWITITSGTTSTVSSIVVMDSMYVYAVLNDGTFLKSVNGGINWSSYVVTASSQLLAMDCKSRDTVYTSGTSGTFYKSVNGGLNWTSYTTGTVNNFWDISAVDNNNVFLTAYYGTIRGTNDGGSNFFSSYANNLNFEGVSMVNKQVGFACGSGGLILRTVNGGKVWTQQTSNTTASLNEIFFINAKTGFAAGTSGTVLKTTDCGGDNFELLLVEPNGGEIIQQGTTRKIIWSAGFSGNVKLEYTTNNGSTWNTISGSVPAGLFEFNWTLPSVNSDQCKVRVSSVSNPSIADESNSSFTILPNTSNVYTVPELLYYKFNNGSTTTPNYSVPRFGIISANILGHTLQNGGLFDSALVGSGGTGSANVLNSQWATTLPKSGWTIGFWVSEIALGTATSNPVYIFGDEFANNLRCYYAGSGGLTASDTAIMLRGTGLSEVRIPVVRGQSYYIHYVYDSASANIKGYRNGTLVTTVPQAVLTFVGNGPFKVGGHSSLASSLAAGMKLDEFRVYSRALNSTEIGNTWNKQLPYLLTNIHSIETEIANGFKLHQNYPNPFNPVTNINFDVAKSGLVQIRVYDILGKEVDMLANEVLQPGRYKATFDASKLSSGIYFYRINAGGFSDIKRMIVLK